MKLQRSEPEIETLVSRIRWKEIDLQPEFQRGEIWDLARKQRLIDTILREWYVPAVHIVRTEEGEVVLDGQQRLAAIRDFYDDEFAIDGTIDPPSDSISALHGRKYSQLPPAMQRAVGRFVLPVITLTDYDPAEPNELFFRLNQSYNLTPPEKRNALHGAARDQVKNLVREFEGIGLFTRDGVGFNNNRLAYDDIISRACVSLELGTLRLHINNSVVEDFYRKNTGFSDDVLNALQSGGRALYEQIQNASGRIKFNKGTLQTWLVYCAWAPIRTGLLPATLLADFEMNRLAVRRGAMDELEALPPSVQKVLSLYDDRASYRVTDVSSVLIRDLAIHAYSHHMLDTPAEIEVDLMITQLSNAQVSSQQVVSNFIAAMDWGSDLLRRSMP